MISVYQFLALYKSTSFTFFNIKFARWQHHASTVPGLLWLAELVLLCFGGCIMLSTCLSVRLSPNLWTQSFENGRTSFDVSWDELSTTWNSKPWGQEVKGQGHMRLIDLEVLRRHHSWSSPHFFISPNLLLVTYEIGIISKLLRNLWIVKSTLNFLIIQSGPKK